jgi:hypothetical protein
MPVLVFVAWVIHFFMGLRVRILALECVVESAC